MSYELSWHTPDRVLFLHISGDYTTEDAKYVNGLILQELNTHQHPLVLLIDAMAMNRPSNFQELRNLQTFMNHPKMKRIVVAASDRFVKLAMTVVFNISRAAFNLSDTVEVAKTYV